MGCGMGCGLAKPPQAQGPEKAVRRRLSVESVEDSVVCNKPETGREEDRSLLMQLNTEQLLDYISGEGRKYSISSETDKALNRSNSFSSKSTVFSGDATSLDVSRECIGYACKKGLKPEAPNQDSFFICKVEGDYSIYGVFDGHGRKGHDVSNFVKDYLPKILLGKEDILNEPITSLKKAFDKTQRLIEQATSMSRIDASRSGSTASVMLHDHKKGMLYSAHVGDSRCVLAKKNPITHEWQAVDLTEDHKPNLPAEKARIERNGGQVKFDGGYNYRVYAKGKRYPGLNMSRAMGDLLGFHDAGISAEPDVCERHIQEGALEAAVPSGRSPRSALPTSPEEPRTEEPHTIERNGERRPSFVSSTSVNSTTPSCAPSVGSHNIDPLCDKFVLLCSDGVWEFMTSDDAVQVVAQFDSCQAMLAAEQLASESWDRWMDHMHGEVVDDITALVVHLSPPKRP